MENMKYILTQEVDHPTLETAPIGAEFVLEPETDLFVCVREGFDDIRIDAALIHVHGDSFDEVEEPIGDPVLRAEPADEVVEAEPVADAQPVLEEVDGE